MIAGRIHDPGDQQLPGLDSRQLDARLMIVALRQLLIAHELQRVAVRDLRMDKAVIADLSRARSQYEQALPGVKHMRDALMHFDDWARGQGKGPQDKAIHAGGAYRDVAAMD
jgi:hypothetical protein